ncbi:MAG: hypothetical protein IPJ41_02950 [Phycisphaerales bacterium]|nr:hypothetical protein [Phycisphaerales bacterium]
MVITLRRSVCGLIAASALLASACGPTSPFRPFYDEGGSGASIDEFTFVSEPHSPKSVSLVDTRTEEVIFAVDIPVGQQLVVNFDDPSNTRGNYMSGNMRWALMKAGNRYGKLSNRIDVPPANSRRLEMNLRPGPEVSTPPQVETMTPPPLSDASGQ